MSNDRLGVSGGDYCGHRQRTEFAEAGGSSRPQRNRSARRGSEWRTSTEGTGKIALLGGQGATRPNNQSHWPVAAEQSSFRFLRDRSFDAWFSDGHNCRETQSGKSQQPSSQI